MYSIIIADDETIIREGLKCLIDWETAGFTIIGEAANGEQAYQELSQKKPDVALLDIRMPKMLGLEAIRKVREDGYTGKIIILSGYSDFKYAQEAIRYGVQYYLTKPIDEDELLHTLTEIRKQLDEEQTLLGTREHYRKKARKTILQDILLGKMDFSHINAAELQLNASVYQVVICGTYNLQSEDFPYHFSDLLRVANQDFRAFDLMTSSSQEIVLLKGKFCLQKFNEFLERYQQDTKPQANSPLDTLFLAYGRPVSTIEEISLSYEDAKKLMDRRFFCDQKQHTIGYDALPENDQNPVHNLLTDHLMTKYATRLVDFLQTFNRNMVAETLNQLQNEIYNSGSPIENIRLFLTDLYLQVKEHIKYTYPNAQIPFPSNADIIGAVQDACYLYEIILFFTEQFSLIMNSIGTSSQESVLDDIIYYIQHNHAKNITLENISPLFGYNSSYLGKIFRKKTGENFNSYVDSVRIEHAKDLLLHSDMKVYQIAETVGYRNVDYFHIKFKKYVNTSPAEFRKSSQVS